jgi:hypothetical protein
VFITQQVNIHLQSKASQHTSVQVQGQSNECVFTLIVRHRTSSPNARHGRCVSIAEQKNIIMVFTPSNMNVTICPCVKNVQAQIFITEVMKYASNLFSICTYLWHCCEGPICGTTVQKSNKRPPQSADLFLCAKARCRTAQTSALHRDNRASHATSSPQQSVRLDEGFEVARPVTFGDFQPLEQDHRVFVLEGGLQHDVVVGSVVDPPSVRHFQGVLRFAQLALPLHRIASKCARLFQQDVVLVVRRCRCRRHHGGSRERDRTGGGTAERNRTPLICLMHQ